MEKTVEKTVVPQEVLDLVGRQGGIGRVSDEALAPHGFRRVHSESRGAWTLVTDSEFARLRGWVQGILGKYRGYLFCHDLDRLQKMRDGAEFVTANELARIVRRAERFIEAKIPPIFNPDFYTMSARISLAPGPSGVRTPAIQTTRYFPSTDFIIQYGSGNYERRLAGKAVELQRGHVRRGPRNLIGPATVEEVLNFRRNAFTEEGTIESALIREVQAYVSIKFRFKNDESRKYALENDYLIFLFLEEILKPHACEPRIFEEWDGDVGVVRGRRWYLRFAPWARAQIIRSFLGSLSGRPNARDRETLARLKEIFPDECTGIETALETRAREEEAARRHALIRGAEAGGNYRLPEVLFVEEPWRSLLLPQARIFFRTACEAIGKENPTALFGNAEHLHEHVAVPSRLALVPEFKEILDAVRLARVKTLGDDEFAQLFGGETGWMKLIALGHAKYTDEADSSTDLRTYLLERHRALCAA